MGEGVPAIHQRTIMKDIWFDTSFTISKESPVELGWRDVARLTGSVAEEQSGRGDGVYAENCAVVPDEYQKIVVKAGAVSYFK